MRIGFIGLGIMGKPMSLHLVKAGYEVVVFDINVSAIQEVVAKGARSVAAPSEVAAESDIVFTMLPNGEHVKTVVLGEKGIIHGARVGTIVVDMSSISPIISKEIAATLEAEGIEMIDASVSGGELRAHEGTLSIMAGGKEEIFNSIKPILTHMGQDITLVGKNGCGTTAKLANQILVNVHIAAMSEALILAAKAGINLEKMYQAIRGGLAGSAILDAKVPLVLERDFTGGGRIDINAKDLTNVMDTAHAIGVPLPLTSQVLEMFQSLKADGKEADDHGGLIQYYEKIANFQVVVD